MNRPGDAKRSGYVTLLAVTFAFGLATLGTALAVSTRSYLASATSRERAILDRISLESAAAQALSDVAVKGERPLRAVQLQPVRFNGREVAAELSVPERKIDLVMDDEEAIKQAIPAPPSGIPVVGAGAPLGLAIWMKAAGFSASAEDCLRRRVTFGRAPEALDETLGGGGEHDAAQLVIGDQVDLRLNLDSGGSRPVLWVRARFAGGAGRPWRIHDYRRLTEASENCDQSGEAGSSGG